jgi:predicted transcriptional regulator
MRVRNLAARFRRQLKKTKLHAEIRQHVLDLAAEASAVEGIRQGLADAAAGRTRPAREALDEMRAKYDIPR